jgi:tRNA 2-thiouridine synthesizing protein E
MAETMNDIMRPQEADPGFPNAPGEWIQSNAAALAAGEGLNVGDDHWEAVRALQEYYSRHEQQDINARELHDALDEKFHGKGGIRYLYTLFPGGPITQGCRLAGLEAPAGSADSSFGSVQ